MTIADRGILPETDPSALRAPRAVGAGRAPWSQALERWLGWIVVLGLLLLWEAAARNGWVDRRILNPPTQVAQTTWRLLDEGSGWSDTVATTRRFVTGMLVGTIAGTTIGLIMGLFRWPRAGLRRPIQILYPLPRIALFPIMLILLGAEERTYMYAIALGPFFTMALAAESAVLGVDPIYRDMAKSFDTGFFNLYRLVIIPAALPAIMSGVRISLGVALLGTTAVEFLQTQDGLGHLIWRSWQLLSLKESLAGLILTAIIGVVSFFVVDVVERLLIPWREV